MIGDDVSHAQNTPPAWLILWAKTEADKPKGKGTICRYQPLLYHMLDVAAVAGLVWDHWFTPGPERRLRVRFGLTTAP